MNGSAPPKKPRTISHARRAKARTGCRTCKTRKVKCGEERPACHKCVSTGRVCDGYGIWSDPESGNRIGPRSIAVGPLTSKIEAQLVNTSPLSNLKGLKGIEEQGYFEWFKCCTITKLPGAFPSGFWETCLLQASASEPAVMHAILALSSAHKRKVLHSGLEITDLPPDLQEQFMLRHYSKAIASLRPHLTTKDIASARVALITCLVFISLEYIRSNYRAGQTHLHSGLQLLSETKAQPTMTDLDHEIIMLNPKPESIDDWIIDSFARIQAQSDFFGKRSRHIRFVMQNAPSVPHHHFQSAAEARQHLERLIDEIVLLKDHYQAHSNLLPLPDMIVKRAALQAGLAAWHDRCRPLAVNPSTQHRPVEKFAYRLLGIYYATSNIMAACLFDHGEAIFDTHTSTFLSIIHQAIEISKIAELGHRSHDMPGKSEMSSSIADLGWIPPLFFTAMKCRHHRIRMQAIKLLSYSLHKEGAWDARLTMSMAREAVRIEEGSFYEGYDSVDDFHSPLEVVEEKDLERLPVLPEEYRLSYVDVVLPEAGNGRFKMICRKKLRDGSEELTLREYDARFRCWVDGVPESKDAHSE